MCTIMKPLPIKATASRQVVISIFGLSFTTTRTTKESHHPGKTLLPYWQRAGPQHDKLSSIATINRLGRLRQLFQHSSPPHTHTPISIPEVNSAYLGYDRNQKIKQQKHSCHAITWPVLISPSNFQKPPPEMSTHWGMRGKAALKSGPISVTCE